ncbi:MAG: HAD family hydrolase [Candidatus Acidiferrales bacterium]
MSAPEKIGAFFDLDGTLLRPPSLEWRFVMDLVERDEIETANVARWLAHFGKAFFTDPGSATQGNKHYLAGIPESAIADWAAAFSCAGLSIFTQGIARAKWHLDRGHQICLVTGTLAPLARAAAHFLPGKIEICATEIEVRDGRFTGRLAGPHMSFGEKACAVSALAAAHGMDLARSYAYGNEMPDLPMLEAVGNPTAANPSWRLARAARKRGWDICDWRSPDAPRGVADSVFLAPKEAR